MEEHIQAYLEYLLVERHYAPNTALAYRNDLLQLCQFVASERPQVTSWARVDTLLLQAFLLQLKARAYSSATLARKIAAIKSFYFYLFENRVISANPAQSLNGPPVPKRSSAPLSERDVTTLLAAACEPTPKGLRDRAILELLYATGLRATELVALPLAAVDLESGSIRVGEGEESRTLSLPPRALEALRTYLKARPRTADCGQDRVFVNVRGRPLTRQGIWLILKQYVKRAGIAADVTPHSLRRAFAGHRLARGERIQELQRLLGHANLSTTLLYRREHEPES